MDDVDLSVHVRRRIGNMEDNLYRVELKIDIEDKDKTLSVSAKCTGIFETEVEQRVLIERNAIAIMFPYLRSYISTLTTVPGISPIILPPMNIAAMIAREEE